MTVRVQVLTVSDSTAAGTREDRSGPALVDRCTTLGWNVQGPAVEPDEADRIANRLSGWADSGDFDVILTTGGTGIALRDVTPEGTRKVIEREIPGLAELMRSEGLKKTRFAPLTRGIVGTRGRTLIVNLPGSPKGAVENLDTIVGIIPHMVDLLQGRTEHK